MAYIYIIRNSINNKVYIGQTHNSLDWRLKKHMGQINCQYRSTALCEAFVELGKENFWIECLEQGDFTNEELDEKERYYINYYNSLYPNGYNLQTGGKCEAMADISKERIREKLLGREILWGQAVSDTMKEKWQDEEYRNAMSEAHRHKRGKYKKHSKPFRLQLDNDEINRLYKSGETINHIADMFDVSFGAIKRRIVNE